MAALRTLPEALAQGARADAGYCFATVDSDRWRTYADLQGAAQRTAGSLRAAGLRRGDLLGLVLPDAEQFLTTLFGASIAGLTPASIYPPSATGELALYLELTAAILRASGARAVVTSRALLPSFEELRRVCPDLTLVLCAEDLDGPIGEPDRQPSLGGRQPKVFMSYASEDTETVTSVASNTSTASASNSRVKRPPGSAHGSSA